MANPNPNPNPHQVSLGTAGSQFFVVASHLSPRSLILDRTPGAEGDGDLQVPSRRHPIVRVGPEGFSEAAWHGAAKLIWGDDAAAATTATAATAADQAADQAAPAAADAAPARAEPEPCASWCAAHEATWLEKCAWGKGPCLGCLECTDALQPLVQPVGVASRTSLLAVGSRSTLPSTAAAQPAAAAAAAAAAAGRSSAGGGELFKIWEVFHEVTWSSWLALCVRQAFGRGRRAGNAYADAITELR